jgi:hypothetical protein
MYINQSRWGQVQGIDILSGCKGEISFLSQATCLPFLTLLVLFPSHLPAFFDSSISDPGKQFDLVAHHMQSIRRLPGFEASRFVIYVERNLGFEAGASSLSSLLGVEHVFFCVLEREKHRSRASGQNRGDPD